MKRTPAPARPPRPERRQRHIQVTRRARRRPAADASSPTVSPEITRKWFT